MGDTKVRLVVTYDAVVDGEFCAQSCPHLAVDSMKMWRCSAFSEWLHRKVGTSSLTRCSWCQIGELVQQKMVAEEDDRIAAKVLELRAAEAGKSG